MRNWKPRSVAALMPASTDKPWDHATHTAQQNRRRYSNIRPRLLLLLLAS
jgi:hypothetical protein